MTYRAVLRLPLVSRLVGSATTARLAEQVFTLVLVLDVLARSGPRFAGLAAFAAFAPGLLLSPVAGALLDRVGAVKAIAADLAASTAVVAALAFAGPDWLVLLLAALYSLTTPLGMAGVRTLLPALVPADALAAVNALDATSYNVVAVLGPVLGGGLFAVFGGRVALLVVAGLSALGALCLLGVREPERAERAAHGVAAAAVAGLRRVLTHPVLRALVLSYGLYQLAWGILVVTVPSVVAGPHGGGPVGLLWGLVGAAGITGALLAGRLRVAGRERALLTGGLLVTGLAAVPMHWGLAGLAIGLLLVGLASGPVDVGLLTLRQRRTDPAELGRVLAVSISLNVIGDPIGAAIGGQLVAHSPVLAFAAAGAAAVLGAAAAWLLLPADQVPV